MHANIAALSSSVPTIATAWSHKYYGIMESLNLEKYICDYKSIQYDDITVMIDEVWAKKKDISENLKNKIPFQQEQCYYGGELVKKTIVNFKTKI